MTSPFIFGRIAEGVSFCNRRNELQRVSSNFRNKIHTVLAGQRRFGKTSLLKKIQSEYNGLSYYRVCSLDAYRVQDEDGFYSYFAAEVIKACSGSMEETIEFSRQFLSGTSSRLAFQVTQSRDYNLSLTIDEKAGEEALHLGNELARKKNFILIISIDNFQNIEKFPDAKNFLRTFKSFIEKHDKTVYCISGTLTGFVSDVFTKADSPLFRFGDLVSIDKINLQELSSFVQNRFSEGGKSITIKNAEMICEMMDCHPYYVQQLAHQVWLNAESKVEEELIRKSVEELVERNLISFEREFENLSVLQGNFIRALLDGVSEGYTTRPVIDKYRLNSSAAIIRVMDSLIRKEILDRRSGKFEFVDPLFHLWLKKFVKN